MEAPAHPPADRNTLAALRERPGRTVIVTDDENFPPDRYVFERIAAIERIHAERLPALKVHPAVGDVRYIGTVAAIELDAEDAGYLSGLRPFLYNFFLEKGVLLRPLGNIVYILPPYVITPSELHFVYDVIADALDRLPVRQELGRSIR